MYKTKTLIDTNLVIKCHLLSDGTGINGLIHWHGYSINIPNIGYVLRYTSLDLTNRSLDHTLIHRPDLLVDALMMITRVINEDDAHDTIEIIGVLIINRDTGLIFKSLAYSTLKNIFVELRKEQGIEWSLTLLERIEVQVITHLIYTRKKKLCKY